MNVDRGDVTLHVRDSGAGIPVVLLHGWPTWSVTTGAPPSRGGRRRWCPTGSRR
jgi:pimeloyl-ACP methyl ester carboxylesterase